MKCNVGLEILCVCSLSVDSIPGPKRVGVKVIMSCVLLCVLVLFCISFSAFVGQRKNILRCTI